MSTIHRHKFRLATFFSVVRVAACMCVCDEGCLPLGSLRVITNCDFALWFSLLLSCFLYSAPSSGFMLEVRAIALYKCCIIIINNNIIVHTTVRFLDMTPNWANHQHQIPNPLLLLVGMAKGRSPTSNHPYLTHWLGPFTHIQPSLPQYLTH